MENKKKIYSWVLYDWANSAFATTILAAVLPIFYKDVAASGLPENLATAYWGYTQTIAMLLLAFLSPVLGAMADDSDSKRLFLKIFAYIGMVGTGLLVLVQKGDYILASCFFILGNIGFAGGNVFYNSFLPDITSQKRIDFVSALGFAAGYLGGGLLLLFNLILISRPAFFGITGPLTATRINFVSVTIWWFVFSRPAFKYLPAGQGIKTTLSLGKRARQGFDRVIESLKNIRRYGELWKFLIAFWLYNDGIGTIIRMAAIYGRELGIDRTNLIGALLLTQFIGIPCSLFFGKLGERIGAKRGILFALFVYLVIVVKGYFLATSFDFWLLAGMVGLVQGGAQALSRSLYGSMVPKGKSAEFYGFFGISSKFASIIGPFIFGLVGQLSGSSRLGVLAVGTFFVSGIIILITVDVEKGRAEAS